jgi:predicted anti-sigma-YlaC factor YlaD
MCCNELFQLLMRAGEEDGKTNAPPGSSIIAHIRLCPDCRSGAVQLAHELPGRSLLTCDQCRARFPAYYEATRPEYPLVEMADAEIITMILHLGQCDICREEYEELVLLSELEEHDELA